jgi:DNA repair protein RadA/Sms
VTIGEVGLSGELRSVTQLERRVSEASRLGFKRCLVPRNGARSIPVPQGIELVTAATLREAVRVGVGERRPGRDDVDGL